MPTMTELQVCSFEESMARVKKAVYTSRVRVKDFLCDFDRLRTGVVHENHFISGLSIAGLDKTLSPQHIGTILDAYRVQTTPSLSMIDWVSFVEDVERIFTTKGLEKDPLASIASEPAELLDKLRYQQCQRTLSDAEEVQVAIALEAIRAAAAKQGLLVKACFDDASRDANSVRRINHVTPSQFKQVLNVKLALKVSAEDLDLVIDKYTDPNYGDLVNYVAFAHAVDPREQPYDPYTLGL